MSDFRNPAAAGKPKEQTPGVVGRLFSTVVAAFAFYALQVWFSTEATLATGRVAGEQFQNSDAAYTKAIYTMHFFSGAGALITLLFAAALVLIWWKPAAWAIRQMGDAAAVILVASVALLLGMPQGHAFFEKTDRTEIYTILPNESAFWIPDVGANKDSQAKMDSEAYLNENKIAAKRFVIPHQKLTGSAGTSWTAGWDYFVPTGRLIIVDRTPFSREWVDAEDRGTSKQKEGFPCQTKGNKEFPGGLNVIAGISIGTSVLEANAAKFLYRFGVRSPVSTLKGDAANIDADGKIIFASVYYGRSLKEVMDDVGRKKVQTLVCNEFARRTFDEANDQMIEMMDEIEKKATAYFIGVGITTDFIGWGDTFEFDKDIQKSVNSRYIAMQDRKNADLLAPVADTIKALAAANAQRSFGEKTDGKLPSTYLGGQAPDIAGPLLGLPNIPRVIPSPAPAR